MSDQHWIITNRRVKKVGSRERVDEKENRALPTFRVATFKPVTSALGPAKVSKKRLIDAVRFVPDVDVVDYEGMSPSQAPSSFSGTAQLYLSLYNSMSGASGPQGDVLFFIHGFNYSWSDALIHLQRLHDIYVAAPGSTIRQIVYFSWPSHGKLTRYLSDQDIAWPSGILLGRLWGKTVSFYQSFFNSDHAGGCPPFCNRKIHLAAHSMAAQVLEAFMSSIRELHHYKLNLFSEVLLLHADADWDALEPGRHLSVLPDYCDRIHVYNHYSDDALRVSEKTKNSEKRLGRHGPRDWGLIPPRTAIVDCTNSVAGPDAVNPGSPFIHSAKRVLGQKTGVRERLFDHWGYLNRLQQIEDIRRVLAGHASGQMAGGDNATRWPSSGPLYKLR